MKFDMILQYVADTEVEVTIESVIDGVIIKTVDGEHKNHFMLSATDAAEMANMLARAAQHTTDLNNKL